MRPIRFPFMVIALLAVGLAAGFALHQLITPREPEHEEVARVQPKAPRGDQDQFETDFGGQYGSWDLGAGGFGGGLREEYHRLAHLMVWIEAMFLQVDTSELDGVLVGGEPAFRRGSEKLLLSSDDKEELLRGLRSTKSFRIISSVSVTSVSGQQALMQFNEEVPYLTRLDSGVPEKEKPSASAAGPGEGGFFYVEPQAIEELQVGSRLNVTATVSLDGVITLVLLPEVSQITGWAELADRPPVPVYRCWDMTTTVYCRDGMSVLMTGAPLSSFGGAPHPNIKSEAEPLGEKTVLLLITARLLEIPAVDNEEKPASEQTREGPDSPGGDHSPLPF